MNPVSSTVAVVVTYNSAAVLAECLTSLRDARLRTVVVDNASGDRSRAIAAEFGCEVVANEVNEGFGRANNRGIAAFDDAEFCLVLNPDVIMQGGALEALLGAATDYPDAMIFGPRLIEPDGRHFFRASSVLEPNAREIGAAPRGGSEAMNLSGACILIRRAPFLALGGFDRNIFLFYEDDDLCYRARKAGWTLRYVHDAIASHVRGGSSPDDPAKTYLVRWHQAWSRAYVCKKHGVRTDRAKMIAINALKYIFAAITRNEDRRMRYAGSVAGSVAALRGKAAAFPLRPEG